MSQLKKCRKCGRDIPNGRKCNVCKKSIRKVLKNGGELVVGVAGVIVITTVQSLISGVIENGESIKDND